MLDALEEAFAAQSAFLADASHELRTPLTILSGQLEVLAMEQDPDPDEVRRVERIARAEIDRMKRLVDDLLLLAHAGETGFLRPEPIDLAEFLTQLVESMRPSAIGASSWGTCRRSSSTPTRTVSPRRCATSCATRSSTRSPRA